MSSQHDKSVPFRQWRAVRDGLSIRLPDWETVEYTVTEHFWQGIDSPSVIEPGHAIWYHEHHPVAEAIRANHGTDWFLRIKV